MPVDIGASVATGADVDGHGWAGGVDALSSPASDDATSDVGVVAASSALIEPVAVSVTAHVATTIDAAIQLLVRFMLGLFSLLFGRMGAGGQRLARNRARAGGRTASTMAAPEMAFWR